MQAKRYPINRGLLKTAIFLFLLFILELTPAKAQRAIDFTLKDLDGNAQRLSDYLEKNIILIDFWATWCVPCVKELPHFQRFYDKYKDKGLLVFAVTVDGPETVALVKPFVKSYKYNFPVLLDTESKVVALYNPRVILPYTILIDREGKIKHVHQGYSLGDERIVEDEILELLEPKEEVRGKGFSFYLNEAFLNRNFSDRDYVESMRGGRTSQVINQFSLYLSSGDYLAGVRADANLDFSPLKDNYRLAKSFFEMNKENFNLRAGDFYYSVGRGLVFSVLKTFEKEGLEYIIDTSVEGGKFTFNQKQFSGEIFGGWLDREGSNVRDKVYGGTVGWRYRGRADFKINFLNSQLEPGSAYGNREVFMESASLDIPNILEKAKLYGEFLLLQKKRFDQEQRIDGHGLYLESCLFMGNLSFLLEFKDYRNLDFEYNRPPLLESEQLPLLANQFATDAKDVSGVSGRLNYSFPKASALIFGKMTYIKDKPEGNLRNILHFFAGLEKKFKETGWLNFIGGYREEEASSAVFYYTNGRTFHYQLNLSYPLTSRLSLEADFKSKDFRGRHLDFYEEPLDYYERRSFFSVHYSPRWIATLFFDQTSDPEILAFKNKRNWWAGQIEIKLSSANFMRIYYGSNKGGVRYSG